jgi:hypothetical protein
MVGEESPTITLERPPTIEPITNKHRRLLVTSSTGSQFAIDLTTKRFRQTQVVGVLQGVVSPYLHGTYWTIKPDPPVEGENLRIWGPNARRKPRIIDLHDVHLEPLTDDIDLATAG